MIVAAEVKEALAAGGPVVALESTIIAHGFPWPRNLDLARAMEEVVRANGAVPATIAIIDGDIRIGLTSDEIEDLARNGSRYGKANAADASIFIARGQSAATTVSATASFAHAAGVRVFATGGIGGVHRGDSGDVSQDLTALGRLPMIVVSAGAKAILDLPRTVEALETLGVLVVGFDTSEFPAFYCSSSGVPLEHRVDDIDGAAELCRAHLAGPAVGALLLANPIADADALDPAMVSAAITSALAAASAQGVHGKALTPFLLRQIDQKTAGAADGANSSLALGNAELAARLAVAVAS
jgi:pseudouridine-5'-phosphate glycosidase